MRRARREIARGDGPAHDPIVHSDRGGHYRWPGWIAICEAAGLTRSMSRKGRSCDSARAEGFFGLLKREFFHGGDWSGVGVGEFSAALDEWMRWFRSGRIFQALGWLTPDERRPALGYEAKVQENVRSPPPGATTAKTDEETRKPLHFL